MSADAWRLDPNGQQADDDSHASSARPGDPGTVVSSNVTALLERATPRPWRWIMDSGALYLWGHNAETVGGEGMVLSPHVCPSCEKRGTRCLGPDTPDADLIEHAVNRIEDYEALAAAVERLDAAYESDAEGLDRDIEWEEAWSSVSAALARLRGDK